MKILLLGAGGIGCEVLKVLSSFQAILKIVIVDMDTIEVTNLHRQFLFQKEHVGQPKATVASLVIERLSPNLAGRIESVVADVFSLPYSVFEEADFIINALDNVKARSRISLMALLSKKILIDAGTAGLEGQVTCCCGGNPSLAPIRMLECFDCVPKGTESAPIPVCTIRQMPTTFTHCVIWAKEVLFNTLFSSAKPTGKNDTFHSEEKDDDLGQMDTEEFLLTQSLSENFIRNLIIRVFHLDIADLASIETLWVGRQKPVPLSVETIDSKLSEPQTSFSDITEYVENVPIERLIEIFKIYTGRLLSAKRPLIFDKDDHDSVAFVHAAAAIRAFIFSIAPTSRFAVRVPAVVSTNSVVAGLIGLHLIRLMKICSSDTGSLYLLPPSVYYVPWSMANSASSGISNNLLICERAQPANENCPTCGGGIFILSTNTHQQTLSDVISQIADNVYDGSDQFTVIAGIGAEFIVDTKTLYDPEFLALEKKTLQELGLGDGTVLLIIPDEEEPSRAMVYLRCSSEISFTTVLPLPNKHKRKKQAPSSEEHYSGEQKDNTDEDDILIM